ncbi:MAG: hypothetical protein KF784_13145 [Fimbriimonadaceae bacterium]|nr:hypothetical protein [Fimbriimonadaceae bacterium]
MKLRKPSGVVFLVGLIAISVAQQTPRGGHTPKPSWPPSWVSTKWTYDDTEFRKVREKLEQMKWHTDVPNLETIGSWVDKYLPPVEKKVKANRFKDVKPLEAYWAMALWAYFPTECQKHAPWVTDLVRFVPAPPSYEYVRVAACVAIKQDEDNGLEPLMIRLLSKWSKDPLVRWRYIDLKGFDGYIPSIHDRMARFADELYKELPLRNEILSVTGVAVYAGHWIRSKKQESFNHLMFYFDEAIKNSQISKPEQDRYRMLKKDYIERGRKAGMKVPGG